MFTRRPFHQRSFTPARLIALCALLLITVLAAFNTGAPRGHARSKRQTLTFEDRVAAQRAIEAVYHRQRIWPKDNPQPKPALDEVLPEAALRAKVEEYLRMSRALEVFTGAALTPEQLQAELERMARQTRQPEVLGALWAALNHDPLLLAECLARPVVAERGLRKWYERKDEGGRMKDEASLSALHPSSLIPHPFDEWWRGVREAMGVEVDAPGWAYRLPEIAAVPAPCGSDLWTAMSTIGAPMARRYHTTVWTGSEMIVWGGEYNVGSTGGRYNPITDTWTTIATTGAPSERIFHSAVWTGNEMIVWGGGSGNFSNTGGRYNPMTNTWTVTNTAGAPSARGGHTAIWTGGEMIVWGSSVNTGGRYNPATDMWSLTSTSNAPSARSGHTAVWTGSEMIIWGGNIGPGTEQYFNTGARYNPATDTWVPINITSAPDRRRFHTAVWTGSEMIIWGGDVIGGVGSGISGGRYRVATDTWTSTATTGAPRAGTDYTAVWTSNEMIVWGGSTFSRFKNGARYNPATNTWIGVNSAASPDGIGQTTAVWKGDEMLIWGGLSLNSAGSGLVLNTGGLYSFSTTPITLSQTTQSFTATGGPGSVAVTAQGGCTWTVTSNAGFLTITSGSSGAGNGTVNFTVAPNTSQTARTGTLSVGGQSFTVTQSGENPVPALAGLTPSSANAAAAAFTLTVNGTGFVSGATVRWNGNTRTTAFVSATQLTAQIPASDLLTLGPATITVFNPAPGGGTSTALSFNVMANVASISAASFSGAELAADSIVAAFGSELATQTLAAPVTPLPTTLAGTTVRVRDSAGVERPAPLFFVAAGQVNYLLPAGTAAGAATVTITSGSGKLSLGAVRIAAVAPGVFTANANGQGVPAAVALRARGEVQSFEPVARFDSAAGRFVTAPLDLGPEGDQVILLLFGTGIRGRSALAAVTCTIGGVSVHVSFAGAQGDLVGLDQINVGPLPRNLAGRGEVDLVLLVDGKAANTVRVNVK